MQCLDNKMQASSSSCSQGVAGRRPAGVRVCRVAAASRAQAVKVHCTIQEARPSSNGVGPTANGVPVGVPKGAVPNRPILEVPDWEDQYRRHTARASPTPAALSRLRLFSGTSNPILAGEVAQYLGMELGKIKCKRFADGEIYVQVQLLLLGADGLGLVATGAVWRRRPTRWLRGVDGLQDWAVEVYTNEPMTNQILGRKYGGRDAREVLAHPGYAEDVVRCGPLLGMTFVLTAARDLPLQEVARPRRLGLNGGRNMGKEAGNKERDPNHPLFPPELRPPPRLPADPSAFRLPPAGQRRPQQQGDTMLSGIRDSRIAGQVSDLLDRATLAARAAEAADAPAEPSAQGEPAAAAEQAQAPGLEDGAELAARRQRAREAATAVLREGLPALGPDGLTSMRTSSGSSSEKELHPARNLGGGPQQRPAGARPGAQGQGRKVRAAE
ncbi:Ribose-phosphate pyrophosphokinase 5, chloroplastic [Tetrabaena socialis]|uniref:Ribose-phosphate pyrophosphokinase 5, chloroplastic n=1 Tax=Tetrabaena socialis TaxID=47790 RepID=A0A2J8A2Y7_9CHLO|nr:Ribose-phosphate pyrophosphokinase 5, chloroplastic [Tetrabaena socialis]|eukprot:PNH06881.1 Ribose-phosphate pyrophosphokinase 5, chloroplastic [Tetrabaena socialis]